MIDISRHPDSFSSRHLGPDDAEIREMLRVVGVESLDQLIDQTVPEPIRFRKALGLPGERSEHALSRDLAAVAAKNQVFRSYIGMGYSDCVVPQVILRNVLLNPGWYTAYTPYQAEIAQGRLEALLNFQTMIVDLTGMEVSNASLLDEATAAAEAMAMLRAAHSDAAGKTFFVSESCHPQTTGVVRTRASALGVDVIVGDHRTFDFGTKIFGALVQYPATEGTIYDYRAFVSRAHDEGALVAMAADLLALTLLVPPGELGADVAVGTTQRFGLPMGYGGPHAAYLATKRRFTRSMPGRLIGVSRDAQGRPALRMALQTREQHIRREKATSNICTSEVLLAVIAGFYAAYHGPKGLRAIAERVHKLASALGRGLADLGFPPKSAPFFDTVWVEGAPPQIKTVLAAAEARRMNFRRIGESGLGISLDETTGPEDVRDILQCFASGKPLRVSVEEMARQTPDAMPQTLARTSAYLTNPVFNAHHTETKMQRYLRQLEARDLSLTHSMIPLGSCTMKLSGAALMDPVTWREFGGLHPFAPKDQAAGYQQVFKDLEDALARVTGLTAVSLQPNSGAQGEYTGLLVIRQHHAASGQGQRDVCLIPHSAHGTNPASATMAGMKVVTVDCDANGNIDLADLEVRAKEHKDRLAAIMVTYPSTHGVFEEAIQRVCAIVHENGGQVYMDGANMNAQVGLCRPGDFGADVCHLNLHKTFGVPHGGGGPGMGPIAVASHLAPYLPRHPVVDPGSSQGIGPVAAAPRGSASILPIAWSYLRLMGEANLARATRVAILNANYVARRLDSHYPVLYKGKRGRVAHECIVDLRPLKKTAGVEVEDVAKRLMDYGFHAPTVSFPVAGTMMIEPTESEDKEELDRFCDAMISIRGEIREIEDGRAPKDDNVLKNAPHTADVVAATEWNRPYSREKAAFPAPWTRARKFWPFVGRVNNVLGDRQLVTTCPAVEET